MGSRDSTKRRRYLRLSWVSVLALCLVSILLRSPILSAVSGVAIAAWSLSLAQNRFGMMKVLRERGRESVAFYQSEASYRAIGFFGVLIGLGWLAFSIVRIL